jgi:hypothetical protein
MTESTEQFRDGYVFTLFLIALVVLTDVAGYVMGAPCGLVGPVAVGCTIVALMLGLGKKPA